MIGLLQRVTDASVTVEDRIVARIGHGLLVLVAVEQADDETDAERLLERLLGYRVFADAAGRMNCSLREIGGGLLLVPQFTLAADTSRGARPSFSSAATPENAQRLFDHLVRAAHTRHAKVATGQFGARMQVSLINDGPVTFCLNTRPSSQRSMAVRDA